MSYRTITTAEDYGNNRKEHANRETTQLSSCCFKIDVDMCNR